jgi:hypothetical protein
MHLVYIYGPPSVGKLTISTHISKRTNIPLFHNHLSVSVCAALFRFGTKEYYELLDSLRLNIIMDAERIGLSSLIFTNAYAVKKNLAFVTRLNSFLVRTGSKISYIQLTCNIEVLYQRVDSAERSLLGKIHEASHLELELANDDYLSRIPFTPHFTYDTTNILPDDTAERIIHDIGL